MNDPARCFWLVLVFVTAICVLTPHANAQLTSPKIGWQATLSKLAHNVSGTVTIVDENTLRVDNFTYDGGGLDVLFYLGKQQTRNSFQQGLPIGQQLLGTAYTGMQPPLVIDLPTGQTLEGWNAIAVWCVDVSVSFGDGTFAPVSTPIPGDFNVDGTVDTADYVVWRNGGGGAAQLSEYEKWRANFGRSEGTSTSFTAAPIATIPEPMTCLLMAIAVLPALTRRIARQY